jgi:hypothetical protein
MIRAGFRASGDGDQHTCAAAIAWYLLLFLVVVAVVCTPVIAATGSPDELEVRKAHLDLVAFTTDTEMKAAITYITPLYSTDPARLNALLAEFVGLEAQIPQVSTMDELKNLTGQLRAATVQFQTETSLQMAVGQGKRDELVQHIGVATAGNPYIEQKEQAYWSTRRTSQLRDFDAWTAGVQGTLDALKAQGFDMSRAQRSLDVIGAERRHLDAALAAKSEAEIEAVNAVIFPRSIQLATEVKEAQAQVSEGERMLFLVEQGNRGVARADQINNDLIMILLDIDDAEGALRSLKGNLATTGRLLANDNLAAAKAPYLLLRQDYHRLAMAYRELANTASLPTDLTTAMRQMVVTLEDSADQVAV